MKYFALLLIGIVVLAGAPAWASGVYDNGPVNGQVDAWTLNFGYAVSDSIQVYYSNPTSLQFWAWLIPGDTISSIQMSIGSAPFGSDLFNSFVSLTQSDCFTNAYGYDVCLESGSFNGPMLNGQAWLTLQNADVPSGDPVYWDENSGVGCQSPGCPSLAEQNAVGTIPSEAFTLGGACGTNCGPTPEPGSFLLFTSGLIGLGSLLRRKSPY